MTHTFEIASLDALDNLRFDLPQLLDKCTGLLQHDWESSCSVLADEFVVIKLSGTDPSP
jgi:hypothetical protein